MKNGFDSSSISGVRTIAVNTINAFKGNMNGLYWMDNQTKAAATGKVNKAPYDQMVTDICSNCSVRVRLKGRSQNDVIMKGA